MKKTFTKEDILLNKGCYTKEKVLNLSFINKEEITIHDILYSEISLKDKNWFAFNSCELNLQEKQKLALNLAWIVLPIFEENYSENKKVRNCLEATEKFILGKITKEELLIYRTLAGKSGNVADAAITATYAITATTISGSITTAAAAGAIVAYTITNVDADAITIYTTKFIATLEKFLE